MNREKYSVYRRVVAPAFLAGIAFVCASAVVFAQAPNPSSSENPFFGSVTLLPASDTALRLSLDGAVRRGLENNLGLREAEIGEKTLRGEKNEALQQFLPTITLGGETGVHQQNLVALGFGPNVIQTFAPIFPGGVVPPNLSFITRYDLTQGVIHFDQTLFSGPVIAAWKAAGAAERAARDARLDAREEVVQQVASSYLRAVAAASEVDNARALEAADQVLFSQAQAKHAAGTVPRLDELRAHVQLQAQQQALLTAQNSLAKDLILLKREIGLDPGQKITLTDPAPYGDLTAETPAELCAVAYRNRRDYRELQNQAIEFHAIHAAYRSQRWPSLSFSGNYAVSQVNDAGTHGNFLAQGTLNFPLFREARLRGDIEASQADLDAVNAQLADLRTQIDQQVRSALLDVDATRRLVAVARSNVALATRALADEIDRVNAGVDDNLPLVTAQATLASAQSNLVESLYQYNLSKLELARAAGIIESQYRVYLGR
ncbi:MAG: TolC family protein [Terracidiphilus sp.]